MRHFDDAARSAPPFAAGQVEADGNEPRFGARPPVAGERRKSPQVSLLDEVLGVVVVPARVPCHPVHDVDMGKSCLEEGSFPLSSIWLASILLAPGTSASDVTDAGRGRMIARRERSPLGAARTDQILVRTCKGRERHAPGLLDVSGPGLVDDEAGRRRTGGERRRGAGLQASCPSYVFTIPDELAPAGSGVGELGTSVSTPPFTAKTDTKLWPAPSTSKYLPSGDSRASMSAPPPVIVSATEQGQ